jgi:hypothetical protein
LALAGTAALLYILFSQGSLLLTGEGNSKRGQYSDKTLIRMWQ